MQAVRRGDARFTVTVDGVSYAAARSSQYRVWCLAELRRHFQELEQSGTGQLEPLLLESLLRETGIWDPLWEETNLPLLKDQESRLPFWADSKMTRVNE